MSAQPVVVALHYQNDVVHPDGRIRVGLGEGDSNRIAVITAAAQLLAGARARNLAIVHVRIAFRPDYADLAMNTPIFRRTRELGAMKEGDWGTEFYAELAPIVSEREFVVTHRRISAFFGTELELLLRQLQTQSLVIAGVATHSVVESTVRDAADRGYAVSVAADACAAGDRSAHAASLSSMSLIAQISAVQDVFDAIDNREET